MNRPRPGKRHEVRIFVSYAHADPSLHRLSLSKFLKWPSVEVVDKWTDNEIQPGSVRSATRIWRLAWAPAHAVIARPRRAAT